MKLVAGGLWSIEVHVHVLLETISDIFTWSKKVAALAPQLTDLPVQFRGYKSGIVGAKLEFTPCLIANNGVEHFNYFVKLFFIII